MGRYKHCTRLHQRNARLSFRYMYGDPSSFFPKMKLDVAIARGDFALHIRFSNNDLLLLVTEKSANRRNARDRGLNQKRSLAPDDEGPRAAFPPCCCIPQSRDVIVADVVGAGGGGESGH
jgi:hypothetical protein